MEFFDKLPLIVLILLFAVGLFLLIKGGDWFVDGSCGIANRFKVPEILIGATIVSIGTTLPEVMVSSIDAISGVGNTAFGNAVGSVICNSALIASISITIKPSETDKKSILFPVIFFAVSSIFYAIVAYSTGYFARWSGIVLLLIFAVYMVITVTVAFKKPKTESIKIIEEEVQAEEVSVLKTVIYLVLGAVMIAVGAWLLVNCGQKIAERLNVPEKVIAIIFIALGTSLPELVTAITSLVKGHSNLSLGNLIGANLFNIVLVSGLSITINPFEVPLSPSINGVRSAFLVDMPIMFLVMAILTLPTLLTGKLKRWQGVSLLAIYFAFCVTQFIFI